MWLALIRLVPESRSADVRLSMTLAYNRGDLTQGMSFWKKTPVTAPLIEHLAARSHFTLAVRIYQYIGLSSEGHRHYPLRPIKALRRSPVTLLPLSPFLDEWGDESIRHQPKALVHRVAPSR